jgi:hypothetical protein
MSTTTESSTNSTKAPKKLSPEEIAAKGPHGSLELANQHAETARARNWKLFVVTDEQGTSCYTFASNDGYGLTTVVKARGWSVSEVERAEPSKVKTLLDSLSPEERAELLALYAPAPQEPKGNKKK